MYSWGAILDYVIGRGCQNVSRPGVLKFYYDGAKAGEVNSGYINSTPQYLIMDEVPPGSYGGELVVPDEIVVDYARVWQHPVPPSATTGSAPNPQETQATLNGTVNPNGFDTHYYSQYGPTIPYRYSAPALPGSDAGSGTSSVQGSATITGLTPGTTYHYRIVATNSAGTTYGNDETFETPLMPFVQMQVINCTTETPLEGPNHSLVQHWSTSEGWKTFTIDGEGSTYSSPQFTVDNLTTEIFLQGSNHTLMQYWATSEGWKKFQVTGSNEVYSNPVLQVMPNGSAEVYVEGASNTLVQHWATSGGWGTFVVANNAFA